jgi:hypothetical protein
MSDRSRAELCAGAGKISFTGLSECPQMIEKTGFLSFLFFYSSILSGLTYQTSGKDSGMTRLQGNTVPYGKTRKYFIQPNA